MLLAATTNPFHSFSVVGTRLIHLLDTDMRQIIEETVRTVSQPVTQGEIEIEVETNPSCTRI
jgi:hypothetical protein